MPASARRWGPPVLGFNLQFWRTVIARGPRLTGRGLHDDLAALVRRTPKHLVGNAGLLQWEHSPYVCNKFAPVKQFCDLIEPRSGHIHVKVRGANAILLLFRLGNR